jgi:lipoate-protein ligase A
MAMDEFLYQRAAESTRTFLRFYQWERPTASLGYSQEADKVVDAAFCASHGVDIVRRLTGGKLVLHHREVTYALASSDAAVFTETLRGSYRLISQALIRGLSLMGIAARLAEAPPPAYAKGTMPCFAFAARDEISVEGRKIIGSAQKRMGSVFLQHGSIPLAKDDDLLASVSRPGEMAGSPGMTSLSEALGRPVDFDAAVGPLVQGFADLFGVDFEPCTLTPADREAVEALRISRYGSDAWTFRRGGAGPPVKPFKNLTQAGIVLPSKNLTLAVRS